MTYKKIGLLQVGKVLDTKGLLARRAGESMLAAGSETGVGRRADDLLRLDGRRPRTFGGTADLEVRRAGMNSVGVVAPVRHATARLTDRQLSGTGTAAPCG